MTATPQETGIYIGGAWADSDEGFTVYDKYTLQPLAELKLATESHVEAAVESAVEAARKILPPAQREKILNDTADLLDERAGEIEYNYVAETGFTPSDASGELRRAANIFRLSAGEAIRIAGEEIPVAATPGSENRLAFTMRVPVGVVAAISPFNAPLSTVAHKIGPAIAAGNSVVLKPAGVTPLSAIALTRALTDAGLPAGYLSLLTGSGALTGTALVSHPDVRFVTFTGSTAVGREIRKNSGLARTHLELGSNSVSIVAADADLDLVTDLVARAGYRKSGQVCTSVQRILADRAVFDELGELLAARVVTLKAGDPRGPDSDIGPLISAAAAARAHSWIESARADGSTVVGGDIDGAVLQPTLVISPSEESPLFNEEAFAPVVSLLAVDSTDDAIEKANAGPYGLQVGFFTQDIDRAFDAARRLAAGGVIINDTSSYHADLMPYGGVKESGHGVEGPRYAVHDMTDPHLIVMNLRAPRGA
jgi:acyl-CoA reductase-like NAD-dependent aldehyde dehydrogenase